MDSTEVGELYLEPGAGPLSDYIEENDGILFWNSMEKEKSEFKSEGIQINTAVITGLVARMGIQTTTAVAFLMASYTISGPSIQFTICMMSCFLIVVLGLFGSRPVIFFRIPKFKNQSLRSDNQIHNGVLISLRKGLMIQRQTNAIEMMARCADVQLGFVLFGMIVMLTGLMQW